MPLLSLLLMVLLAPSMLSSSMLLRAPMVGLLGAVLHLCWD